MTRLKEREKMPEFSPYGVDLFGEPIKAEDRGVIAGEFIVPPFSVLNAREGSWQDRKRAWLSFGIKGEIGRTATSYNTQEWVEENSINWNATFLTGVSIFDPVLCELCYRWFCCDGGMVLDPFAGGSVRGIIASLLGMEYTGIELRQEQVEANKIQAREIIQNNNEPKWICGDSMDELDKVGECDFLFSCPPYGDLEKYSDDPRDLSSMEYHTFLAAYKRIVLRACKKLRNDRFACFVVGDFRDDKGNYRNFVSDTIMAFLEQGLALYNEAILVTSVGSLPVRIKKQFDVSRKMGKTHQNVLVFLKGDARRATRWVNNEQ
jgi:DNA modification methylase